MHRESFISIRKPSIMLVQVVPGAEPAELGPDELGAAVEVLRVRQPLPACQRIRHLRPVAVLVGPDVRSWAMPSLELATRESGAFLLQLGPMIARGGLRAWLERVLEHTAARSEVEDDALAVVPAVAQWGRR